MSPEARQAPTLSEDQIHQLAGWALTLERYFKRPQEVEWAVDQSGQCFILQSRGLGVSKAATPPQQDICQSCAQYPVLVRDTGVVAHAGVGAGVGSIFRAPLAGALFAAEVLYRDPEIEAGVVMPAGASISGNQATGLRP